MLRYTGSRERNPVNRRPAIKKNIPRPAVKWRSEQYQIAAAQNQNAINKPQLHRPTKSKTASPTPIIVRRCNRPRLRRRLVVLTPRLISRPAIAFVVINQRDSQQTVPKVNLQSVEVLRLNSQHCALGPRAQETADSLDHARLTILRRHFAHPKTSMRCRFKPLCQIIAPRLSKRIVERQKGQLFITHRLD